MNNPARTRASREHLTAVRDLCTDLLDTEAQFYSKLEVLLAELPAANLFAIDAAMSLQSEIERLHEQREVLAGDRLRCQRALSAVLGKPVGKVRMSELEPLLEAGARAAFRKRRLEAINRVEGVRHLMRRVDVLLGGRQIIFADLIGALTGQTPSAQCYGAHGRREGPQPVSVLQAVS